MSEKFLVLATGNKGKVLEFQTLLAPGNFTLLTPKDIGFDSDIDETGTTFEANALIKADALANHMVAQGLPLYPVLSDDSGIIVDALGGAPGIYSARYAQDEMEINPEKEPIRPDIANRRKLLRELKVSELKAAEMKARAARFYCVLCYLSPGKGPQFFSGTCEGKVAEEESGSGGFGYDPIFIPEGYGKTFGELAEEVKDQLSHRAKAVGKFLEADHSS